MRPQTECIDALVGVKQAAEEAASEMTDQIWAPFFFAHVGRHRAIVENIRSLTAEFSLAIQALSQAGVEREINGHLPLNPELHMHAKLRDLILAFWADSIGETFSDMQSEVSTLALNRIQPVQTYQAAAE